MHKRTLGSITFLVILVLPIFAQAFNIDRDLASGEFYATYRSADAGWRVEGSFSSSNDIEFFICDADNYTRWKRGENVFFYEHSEQTSGETFNFTIPYDSEWYVIFLNTQSLSTTTLVAEIYYIDQEVTTHTQVSWVVQSVVATPLFIGILVAIGAFCLLGVWIARKREPFPAVNYDKILEKPR